MEKGSAEYEKILDELVGYCNDSGTIDQNLHSANYFFCNILRGLSGGRNCQICHAFI